MITISNAERYIAAIYVRLSNEKCEIIDGSKVFDADSEYKSEKESGSITNQKSFLKRFCNENGIEIYKIYSDDGYSGANFDRPAFNKMIKDIENKKVNMVIVKDLSRFGRVSSKVTYYTDEYFPEHKIRFLAVADAIDTGLQETTDEMMQFRAFFNEWFLRDCSKKVKNGKKTKARDGKVMTTYATYGYRKDPKDKNHYIIDEEIAPIVREIFSYAKTGMTPTQISRILTEKKYPVPSDVVGNTHTRNSNEVKRGWNRNAVKRILQNKTYLGCVINGKIKKVNYKSKKLLSIPEDEWIVKENMHEAIIEQDTFDIVQKHIQSRLRKRTRKYDWLLNGIIECEECGKKLSIIAHNHENRPSRFYLKCNTYSTNTALKLCTPHCNSLERVTTLVLETIKNHCQDYLNEINYNIIAEKAQNQYLKSMDNSKNEMKILERKLEILNRKIDSIYEDKMNKILSQDDFQRMYNEAKNNKENILTRMEKIQNCKETEKEIIDINQIIKEFLKMKEIDKTMLVQLVDRITLSENKEITIYYKFNVLNEKNNKKISCRTA